MAQPLLEGHSVRQEYVEDPNQSSLEREIIRLTNERDRLQHDLRTAMGNLTSLQSSIIHLRRLLDPWRKVIGMLYGELDEVSESETPISANPRANKAWEMWKQKLPGYPAKFIDALLAHKDLDSRQLSIATGCHYTNVAKVIYKLNQAGLINKNGNRYSLKEL